MAVFQNDDGVFDKKTNFYQQRPVGVQESLGLNMFDGNTPEVDSDTNSASTAQQDKPITTLSEAFDAYRDLQEKNPPPAVRRCSAADCF